MSRRRDSATAFKKWKLEILNDEITSSVESLERGEVDEEEKVLVLGYIGPIKEWVAELEGADSPALTADDIDWRIHVVDNRIGLVVNIMENEDELDEKALRGLNLEMKRLKKWKADLERAMSRCEGS